MNTLLCIAVCVAVATATPFGYAGRNFGAGYLPGFGGGFGGFGGFYGAGPAFFGAGPGHVANFGHRFLGHFGAYHFSCPVDGMFLLDENRYVQCDAGKPHIVNCPKGSKNAEQYEFGQYVTFCGINTLE